jgi:hypothetical protein
MQLKWLLELLDWKMNWENSKFWHVKARVSFHSRHYCGHGKTFVTINSWRTTAHLMKLQACFWKSLLCVWSVTVYGKLGVHVSLYNFATSVFSSNQSDSTRSSWIIGGEIVKTRAGSKFLARLLMFPILGLFPRGHFPRMSSPAEFSPRGHFPRRTFSLTDISTEDFPPADFSPGGHFPWGHFPRKFSKFPRIKENDYLGSMSFK